MNVKYSDRLVEITDREMVFRRYYFPFCTAKRVPLEQIASVEACKPSLRNGSGRLWGSSSFDIWFPLDASRPRRDAIFIATLRGASMRIGFTVEDSKTVAGILEGMRLLNEPPG